jgi:electron transport complex protein RnfG
MTIKYLTQAWLVLALAICFGAALAGVQIVLADRIEANKFEETMGQIPGLVPGATGGDQFEIEGRIVYRAVDSEGSQVGWVVPASGQGFADAIELLVGLDAGAETVTGLYVLDQKETPGLGSKIREADFRDRFKGKQTAARLSVTRSEPAAEDEVLAITGATVSSESVTEIVNDTLAELKAKLAQANDKD